MTWIVAALALTGNVLVIRKSQWGFVCWAVANVYLTIHNSLIGEFAQAAMFAVYLILAVWGIIEWRKKAHA